MSRATIHTDKAPSAIGTYSQAITVDRLVFLSGQIPLDPATMEVVDDDVVKLTVYLTDLGNFATVNAVMEDYFRKPYPARAAVGVASLPKGVDVEADAILFLERPVEG